jgi:hypothetical protein
MTAKEGKFGVVAWSHQARQGIRKEEIQERVVMEVKRSVSRKRKVKGFHVPLHVNIVGIRLF